MSLKGKSVTTAAVLAAIFSLGLFCSGCGDYFRPVANPVFQPGGDPQRTRHALVVSRNGACTTGTPVDCAPGSAVAIDVSGDDAVAVFSGSNGVGRNPVYATDLGGTDYVVNRDDDSVSAFTLPIPPNSLNPPNVISLPDGARPVFAATAQSKLFVAESGLAAVADISPSTFSVSKQIPVGNNPVALVATPDGTKLYVLNRNDGNVSVILPANDTIFTTPIPVGASPVWAAVSSDGSRVFVVNQGSNNISVIDTTKDAPIPSSPLPVGLGPNYIVYQASQNRLYVVNEVGNSLSIIENATAAAPATPTVVPPISLVSGACNGQHAISVTALANGTKAYVADNATNSVCVLDTTNNTFIKSIPVGTAPVFIASDSDSFRVYTANSGSVNIAADISIIDTSTDTTVKQSDGTTPLTLCAGPPIIGANGTVTCPNGFVPTFIAMTP